VIMLRTNLVLIGVEHCPGRFVGLRGHPLNLPPRPDQLAQSGAFFASARTRRTRMLHPLLWMAAMALAFAGCGGKQSVDAPDNSANPTLRVLTLNLMQRSPVAGRSERFDRIAEFLESQARAGHPVDVLLLQEGCSGLVVGTMDSLGDLRRKLALKGLNYSLYSRPYLGVPALLVFRIGILTRAKILYTGGAPLDMKTGNWFDDFPLPGRKRVVAAGLDHAACRVNVFSVHLSSGGNQEARVRQARDLLGFINQFSITHPADIAILGGDMNAGPDTPVYELLAAEFVDAHTADAGGSPAYTFNLPRNPHCHGYPGGPSRIDFVFVRGRNIKVLSSEVVFNGENEWVSDHCGVLVVFSLGE